MAENTLAALLVYEALGLPLDRAHEGASRIVLSRWRGEESSLRGGGIVVNDAYNANPVSMRAALVDLSERAGDGDGLRSSARWPSSAPRPGVSIVRSGTWSQQLAVDVLVAVGDGARLYLEPGVSDMHWIPDAAAFDTVAGVIRPGDAVLVKASRAVGLEGIPARIEKLSRGMVRVLIAGLVAMVIAVVIGPIFIEWLRRSGVGQQIREEGPARHIVKQGTPTMGGLLILAAAAAPFVILSLYTLPGLGLLFLALGCGLIGFVDDYLKVRRRRSLGLPGWWKMLGLVLITIGVAGW